MSLRTVQFPDARADSKDDAAPKTWKACGSGELLVGKVDGTENFGLFGGLVVNNLVFFFISQFDCYRTECMCNAANVLKSIYGILNNVPRSGAQNL